MRFAVSLYATRAPVRTLPGAIVAGKGKVEAMETIAGIIGTLSIIAMLYLLYVLLEGGDER